MVRVIMVALRCPLAAGAPSAAGPTSQRIAILLPLSGAHADIGQAMLNGAKLALDAPGAPPLDAKDTGSTPDGTAAAARAAIAARSANVAVLAFTNDLSQARPGVWTLGIPQVSRCGVWSPRAGRGRTAVRRIAARYGVRPRHGAGTQSGDREHRSSPPEYPVLCARHGRHQFGPAGPVGQCQPARTDRCQDSRGTRPGDAGGATAGTGTGQDRDPAGEFQRAAGRPRRLFPGGQSARIVGVDGWFPLLPDGQVRGALAVFVLERGGSQMVEPAPQSGNVPGA